MASGGAAIDSPRCVIGRQQRRRREDLLHKCYNDDQISERWEPLHTERSVFLATEGNWPRNGTLLAVLPLTAENLIRRIPSFLPLSTTNVVSVGLFARTTSDSDPHSLRGSDFDNDFAF